jgi:hypothetical protein
VNFNWLVRFCRFLSGGYHPVFISETATVDARISGQQDSAGLGVITLVVAAAVR